MRAAVATGAGFTTDAPTFDGNQATLFGHEARTGDDDAVTGGVGAATAPSDTGPLTPGQPFGTRYHLIRALGVGGMGAVYQAWDAELGVAVAIKVIRPEVMADPSAAAEVERRFKRELLLARQVTHKNVVRIHDLGEIDGIKYITMSYVEGGDLSSLLKREGRLPAATVLSIARQIVSGLVEAHKAGVVHRDLKPANIMIDKSGDALIMDFGIARSTGAAGAPAGTDIQTLPRAMRRAAMAAGATQHGAVVGTVEYMAPEQARGQEVDQRADIYALGLMLYDMLVGREHRAGHTDSAIEELRARMEQPPAPVKSVVPEIPDALDQMISRCLQPDPANRYQTTEELAADLARLDDDGVPIPERRRFTPRLIAAAVLLVAGLVTGTWWLTRTPPPPKKHDPVSVIIADFQNNTGDSAFDHTLEPIVRRGLEGASFISAYDRSRIRFTFGVRPETWDPAAARQLAVKQAVGVVVSGSIERRGNGYELSINAAQTVTGKPIADTKSRASNKDQVLGVATKLVTDVRRALGDETSGSAQLFAMRSLSTTSLDVVSHYVAGVEAQSRGKYDEAATNFVAAVKLDPNFGLGYQGLAAMSRNQGRLLDAENYNKEALRHLDTVTERERFVIRASYYLNTGDYQQCVKEYGELISRYAGDAIGYNNRARCLSGLRNMREAVGDMRQAVRILPRVVLFQGNLAVYSDYAGDFATAAQVGGAMPEPTDLATLAKAFAVLGQGNVAEAIATYKTLATLSIRGASWATSGLADAALYEGRFADAAQLLEQGAKIDVGAKNADRAARKLTSLAYAQLLQGHSAAAVATVDKALAISRAVPVRFFAARALVEAAALPKAGALAVGLASELAAEPHAYGKIIEGEAALKGGDARQAVTILTDANAVLDTWVGHFDLGRAYLELGAFPQADSEFDRCIQRRGEVLSLLVDEEPTYGYLPPVYYYQGRVREGLNNAGFAELYREYLKMRGTSTEDRLLVDVRKRAGQ